MHTMLKHQLKENNHLHATINLYKEKEAAARAMGTVTNVSPTMCGPTIVQQQFMLATAKSQNIHIPSLEEVLAASSSQPALLGTNWGEMMESEDDEHLRAVTAARKAVLALKVAEQERLSKVQQKF